MVRVRVMAVALIVAFVMGQALPAGASVLVRAKCDVFDPVKVSVQHGTKVVWKGVCGTHTVTAYGANWSKDVTIGQGQTTSKTFKRVGLFKYRCRLHSSLTNGLCAGMCGKIRVT